MASNYNAANLAKLARSIEASRIYDLAGKDKTLGDAIAGAKSGTFSVTTQEQHNMVAYCARTIRGKERYLKDSAVRQFTWELARACAAFDLGE